MKELNFTKYKTLAIIAGVTTILVFIIITLEPSANHLWEAKLGTTGDYFGGILNPIFGLLSLFALLATIKIQTEELGHSRQELQLTREELVKSTKAQEEQSLSIKIQNFENTFFSMIDIHRAIVEDIKLNKFETSTSLNTSNVLIFDGIYGGKAKLKFLGQTLNVELENKDTIGKESLKFLVDIVKAYVKKDISKYDKFHDYFEDIIGHYFGFTYQVLLLIKDAKENTQITDSSKYSNLFRSQFSKTELSLLAYHCKGSVGSRKFKGLVEEFEFFEHLPSKSIDIPIASQYKINAFGKNEKWIEEIKKVRIQNRCKSQ